MCQMIEDNTSSYLDLNRFLDPSITITPSPGKTNAKFKYPHHASAKQNKIWDEDDRFKFENQVLMFVKDITAQITDLSKLLGMYILYLIHQNMTLIIKFTKYQYQRQLRVGYKS